MYILSHKMYILAPQMYILAPKMDKSLPFEKVHPQWQLLYLFFWECGCQCITMVQNRYQFIIKLVNQHFIRKWN